MDLSYLVSEVMPSISASAWKVLCFLLTQPTASYRVIQTGTGISSAHTIQTALEVLMGKGYITATEGGDWEATTYTPRADLLPLPTAKNAVEPTAKSATPDAEIAVEAPPQNTPTPTAKNAALIGISIKPKEGGTTGVNTPTPAPAHFHQGHPPPPLATSTANGASVSAALQHPTVKKIQAAFGVNLKPDQVHWFTQCDDQAAVDATIDDYRKHPRWHRDNGNVFYQIYLKHRDAIEAARPKPRPWETEPAPAPKQVATLEEKRASVSRVLANHPIFGALAHVDQPAPVEVTA